MLGLVLGLLISRTPASETNLNVFAAASLKEAFTDLAEQYEASRPGVEVRLNFAGSQTLATQISHGAPADVFASAAVKNMRDIDYAKDTYRVFAHNELAIAVRKGFSGLKSPRDLAKANVIVIADPAVPVGHYTESFFSKARASFGDPWLKTVRSHVVSREADVKAVLAKVKLGEADAGIVYVSDVATAKGTVQLVTIPDEFNENADYPVAVPEGAAHSDEAKTFIDFLFRISSQKTLERSGLVSVTRAVRSIMVGKTRVQLPLSSKYAKATVKTDGGRITHTGVLVTALPEVKDAKRATFVGADGRRQTVTVADLAASRAVLVRSTDGNYRLIAPGLGRETWINWIRRIELQ
ncbi:MAG TPA: molybdate ABC transporter substrate-binding protein [Fimbriimonadaceae bacterium]|nr:molybdate ABC transporter substrate-binding protein [Fimbriimonadaceae bacterium]